MYHPQAGQLMAGASIVLTLFRCILFAGGVFFWIYAASRLVRYVEARGRLVVEDSALVQMLDAIAERVIVQDILFGFAAFFAFAVLTILQRHVAPAPSAATALQAATVTRHTLAPPAAAGEADDPLPLEPPAAPPVQWTDQRWGWHGELNGRSLYLMEAGAGRYRLWLSYVDGMHVGSYKSRSNARAAAERAAHAG